MLQHIRTYKPVPIYNSNQELIRRFPYNKLLTNTNLYKLNSITDTGFPQVKLDGTTSTQILESSSFNIVFKNNTDYIIRLRYISNEEKQHYKDIKIRVKFLNNVFKIRTADSYIVITYISKTKVTLDILQLEWKSVLIQSIEGLSIQQINNTRLRNPMTIIKNSFINSNLYIKSDGSYKTYPTHIDQYNRSDTYDIYYYRAGLYIRSDGRDYSPTGLHYSTDGVTWKQSNLTTGYINSICYFNGLYVVTGTRGQCNGVFYSTDGKTWTKSNAKAGGRKVIYANKLWQVSVNVLGGGAVYYSADGKTWSTGTFTTHVKPEYLYSIVYMYDRWIGAGHLGDDSCHPNTVNYNDSCGLFESFDGKSWSRIPQSRCSVWDDKGEISDGYIIDYGDILFCYKQQHSGAATSYDGITWKYSKLNYRDAEDGKILYDRDLQAFFYMYQTTSSSASKQKYAVKCYTPNDSTNKSLTDSQSSVSSLRGIQDNKLYLTNSKYINLGTKSNIPWYMEITNSDIY